MSLLSRNRLSIVVSPSQIAMLHTRREWTWRGGQLDVVGRELIRPDAKGKTEWGGVMGALGDALPRFAQPGMRATLILSNHFVNYVLVPWRDNMSDDDELAYARHCFTDLYGEASDLWDIRVSPSSSGAPALASAVDRGLLDELHRLVERSGIGIKSIQPHLMVAFNSCHSGLHGRTAWFALLEPGNLCLSLLQKGQFAWVRKIRIGDAWHDELPRILEREAYLADDGLETCDVFLWAPQLEGKNILARGRWNIMHLKPSLY